MEWNCPAVRQEETMDERRVPSSSMRVSVLMNDDDVVRRLKGGGREKVCGRQRWEIAL